MSSKDWDGLEWEDMIAISGVLFTSIFVYACPYNIHCRTTGGMSVGTFRQESYSSKWNHCGNKTRPVLSIEIVRGNHLSKEQSYSLLWAASETKDHWDNKSHNGRREQKLGLFDRLGARWSCRWVNLSACPVSIVSIRNIRVVEFTCKLARLQELPCSYTGTALMRMKSKVAACRTKGLVRLSISDSQFEAQIKFRVWIISNPPPALIALIVLIQGQP